MQVYFKKEKVKDLINALLADNYTVFGPVKEKDKFFYRQLKKDQYPELESNSSLKPLNSLKEVCLPQTEVLFNYKYEDKQLIPDNLDKLAVPVVVFGAKPCDSDALKILDKVHTWDYKDELYLEKRDKTILISLVCSEMNHPCFCTSVNGAPDSESGSDIMLSEIKDDKTGYIVKSVTSKGEDFLKKYKSVFSDVPANITPVTPIMNVAKQDFSKVKEWLLKNFESDFWQNDTIKRCLGCGICTFNCPTCHCFDIVDEASLKKGTRRKNWDACMFPNFTKMFVHQPRPEPYRRWRQRLEHKFYYYPDKFEYTLCVGCGRCFSLCPVGIDIKELVSNIQKL